MPRAAAALPSRAAAQWWGRRIGEGLVLHGSLRITPSRTLSAAGGGGGMALVSVKDLPPGAFVAAVPAAAAVGANALLDGSTGTLAPIDAIVRALPPRQAVAEAVARAAASSGLLSRGATPSSAAAGDADTADSQDHWTQAAVLGLYVATEQSGAASAVAQAAKEALHSLAASADVLLPDPVGAWARADWFAKLTATAHGPTESSRFDVRAANGEQDSAAVLAETWRLLSDVSDAAHGRRRLAAAQDADLRFWRAVWNDLADRAAGAAGDGAGGIPAAAGGGSETSSSNSDGGWYVLPSREAFVAAVVAVRANALTLALPRARRPKSRAGGADATTGDARDAEDAAAATEFGEPDLVLAPVFDLLRPRPVLHGNARSAAGAVVRVDACTASDLARMLPWSTTVGGRPAMLRGRLAQTPYLLLTVDDSSSVPAGTELLLTSCAIDVDDRSPGALRGADLLEACVRHRIPV